jgi:hypothetical protein
MEAIMTQVTTSISEFKKNPNESDIIFDLELAPKLKKRMSGKGKAVKVKIEEL